MNAIHKTFVFLSLILLFSSCNLFKGSKSFENTDRKTAKLVNKLIENQFTADWIQMKGKAKVDFDGQKMGFPFEVRMQKDEIIWGVAKKFGFEVGRFFMTPDSVTIVNRIGRNYDTYSWSEIGDMAGDMSVSFNMVQQTLLGNPIFFSNEFQMDQSRSGNWIRSENSNRLGYYEVSKEGQLISMELSDKSLNGKVAVSFDSYEAIDNQQDFAFFRTFELYDKERLDGQVDLDINQVKTAGPFEFPFEISRKYSKGLQPN